jgi:hypothetical protein
MTIPKFARRQNQNSSIDSICTTCFQTIASVACEEELVLHEEKHVCDQNGEFSLLYLNSGRRTDMFRRPAPTIEPTN